VISISAFEKVPLYQLFQQPDLHDFKEKEDNQLTMFDL